MSEADFQQTVYAFHIIYMVGWVIWVHKSDIVIHSVFVMYIPKIGQHLVDKIWLP